jgi:excisionase family DNA binding protein
MKVKTLSELISVAEAGRILGCSTPTIRKMCQDGKLKRVQLHEKAYRIARRDVEALVAHATIGTISGN